MSKSCYTIDCSSDWKINQKKRVDKTNICWDNLDNNILYKYEYKGLYYEDCQDGTLISNSRIKNCSCNIFFDKLKENLKNYDTKKQILILDILDYLIDKGDITIWSSISSKKFYLPLINLLKIKDIPDVQIKLLYLLKKWGIKFEPQKNIIPNFNDIYTRLKTNGVEFQDYNEPDYNKYFIKNNESFYYFEKLKGILKEENFEHKYRRLVDYLLNMNEKIKLANELIDIGDNEQLDEIIDLLDKGKDMLKDTIISGRLKDEKLMEYTLGTNEDISNTILRKEELDKGLIDVRQYVSYFEKNNTFQGDINNKN